MVATPTPVIPGLNAPLTQEFLLRVGPGYNKLDECPKNSVPSMAHVAALGGITREYGLEKLFGTHLIHRHTAVPNGCVPVGEGLPGVAGGIRVMAREVTSMKPLGQFRGHIFQVNEEGVLAPYEFRKGPSIDASSVDLEFYAKFTNYIMRHALENSLGLQFRCSKEKMVEFDCMEGGTVMIPKDSAIIGKIIQTSGWFSDSDDPEDGEQHTETTTGNHKVFFKMGATIDELVAQGVMKS